MNALKLVIVSILLFSCGNLLASSTPKMLVCHVGDAGQIDLIVVAANSNHLDNASHSFEGLWDYEPSEVGATGEGTEDFDGDGVDEGCEPPVIETCPCWDEAELQAVTGGIEGNQSLDNSCNAPLVSSLPIVARIENVSGSTPGVEGSFTAADFGGGNTFCQTRDFDPFFQLITSVEAASCMEQIVDRCAAIGSPITPPPPPAQ